MLNNVGFAYLTVACIDIPALTAHLPQFFITFIVGSVLFNGVCVLLMKPAKRWLCAARRSRVHKKVYFCRYLLIFLLWRATISVVSSCPKH